MSYAAMADKIRARQGFIAALDQSGGSTPKALRLYGVEQTAYDGEAAMFDLIHAMRSRIVAAPAFTGDKVAGAILFEMTMDRAFAGKPAPTYLWEERGVVPFLKIDKGLEAEADGVQLMKPMPDLDALLARAKAKGVFGTKERSVINAANPAGIKAVVAQQFEVGQQVAAAGLVPIIEPEVNINMTDKARAEDMVREELAAQLDALPEGTEVMLKLTLPETANHYAAMVAHPACMGVVALSGGYARDEANRRLAQNAGMVASFSRALTEGLSANQDDATFNKLIEQTIGSIHAASVAG